MTTETPIQKQEVLTVNGCRIAKNQKSWELKARATFQDRDSNWWIPKRGESHIENGRYLCLIERGNKWTTDRQTDDDWQYNWEIIQFNIEQEAPTEEAKFEAIDAMPIRPPDVPIVLPQETQRDDHPHKRASIEKQTQDNNKEKILRMATDIFIAQNYHATEPLPVPDVLMRIDEVYLGLLEIPTWNTYDGVPDIDSDATGSSQSDGFGDSAPDLDTDLRFAE